MNGPLHRRVAALEAANQPAESPDADELARAVFDAFWCASASFSGNTAAALRLADRIEAGDLEGLPPLIRASPARAAAIARAAARFLSN